MRGSIIQLVHSGWEQVYVLITHKGAFCGGYYHKQVKEAFYVIQGKLEVTFINVKMKSEKQVSHGGGF